MHSNTHLIRRKNIRTFCDEVGGVINFKVDFALVPKIMVSKGPSEQSKND